MRQPGVPTPPSSRRDESAAGWYGGATPPPRIGGWEQALARRRDPKWDTFSWLTLRLLLESANDVIAARAPTIVRDRRRRYVAAQRAAGAERADHGPDLPGLGAFGPDFVVDWTARSRPRFLVVGDPGEADASQYATLDPLLDVHKGDAVPWDGARAKSDFMVVLSDVIYPAGDINDYVNGFYIPFRAYDRPIYALPGNHDWYDGLNGFMYHLCSAEPLPPLRFSRRGRSVGDRVLRALWLRASRPDRDRLSPYVAARRRLDLNRREGEPDATTPPRPVQPAPYFALELEHVRLVAIDTGVTGELDDEQGRWLLRVSAGPKPKVLLTGKPIWANHEHRPGPIVWGDDCKLTVDDIVRDPAHHYVAAIGGDTHNYQRYPLRIGDRTIQYIVAGGGGAYLSSTHTIPTVEQSGCSEDDFRCYPLRGDSLALFCRRVGPLLFKALITALLVAGAAAALVFAVVPLDAGRRDAALLAAAAVAGLAVAGALVSRLRLGTFATLMTGALAIAGAVAALVALSDVRATVALVVALAAPVAAAAAILVSYSARGSLPATAPNWLPVLALLGLAPALWAPYGGAAAILYAAAPLLAALVLVPLAGRLRRDAGPGQALAYRALTAGLWLALAGAVILRFGEDWMATALAVVLGLMAVAGFVVPRLGPGRREVSDPRYDTIGSAASVAVALSLAGLALAAAGDDAAGVIVAGVAALLGAVAAAGAAYLLLVRRLADPRTLWYLRRGEISPAGAARFVADEMKVGAAPTRPGRPDPRDARRRGMANVVRRLGSSVSVLADTNAPPFYKSFLSAEVNDAHELEIRCWGVTGYDDELRSPSLDDVVTIRLAPEG